MTILNKFIFVICIFGFAWIVPHAYSQTTQNDKDQIIILLDTGDVPLNNIYNPGNTIKINARIENITDHPIMILHWQKMNSMNIDTGSYYSEIYGYTGPYSPIWRKYGVSISSGPYKGSFMELLPGTSPIGSFTIIPMLPGTLNCYVKYECKTDKYKLPKSKEGEVIKQWPNGFVGTVYGELEFKIPPTPSAEMKRRYDDVFESLQNENIPIEQKLSALKAIALEKHYLAANFLAKVVKNVKDEKILRDAKCLLFDLAKFGTAFESYDLVLAMLKDETLSCEKRLEIMAWFGEILSDKGFQNLAEQFGYRYSKEQLEQTQKAIQVLADRHDLFWAVKAIEILTKLKEQEEKDKKQK